MPSSMMEANMNSAAVPDLVLVVLAGLAGCASEPASIGRNTYLKSETVTPWGSAEKAEARLTIGGNKFCASLGKKFLLVNATLDKPYFGHDGGATVSFRCLDASDPEYAREPTLRPDNGVSTVENQ